MSTRQYIVICFSIIALSFMGCDSSTNNGNSNTEEQGHGHSHGHEHGPNGGELLEVGEHLAHIEFIHDEKVGKITLYILGKDAKTAEAIEGTPMLNLRYKETKKQLKTVAMNTAENKSSHFEVTDEILKEEVAGRIAITIKGVKYNIKIEHDHGHDH
ncbi:hypothetical protein [Candidatus Uabimicrobium amorphum]|uniref:Lipoprotein n=1 Tax=Uabimicrobium amorphum TaxID=2596890 RepID=A0A5S9IS31_UABAM|nr:hypothetical protein [Candidatus Uabimicrobium amorphum]BBM87079.1 hypothetical protein UABAM_05482 [Candidatus Uabimicrobium amorphum]